MEIILIGSDGNMGKAIKRIAGGTENVHIAAEIDRGGELCVQDIVSLRNKADCVIDFSSHLISREVCAVCMRAGIPLVTGTTGHTEEELTFIWKTAEKIPVFFSENMSFCMLLIKEFVRKCSLSLPGYDVLITETHRKGKADTPSGTAVMLRNEIQIYSENSVPIEIFSIRKDNCAGKHEIAFSGEDEEICLTHTCFNREAYARGALMAAEFIITRQDGLYTPEDLIKGETR